MQKKRILIYFTKGEPGKRGAAIARMSFVRGDDETWQRVYSEMTKMGFTVVTRKKYYAFKLTVYSEISKVE